MGKSQMDDVFRSLPAVLQEFGKNNVLEASVVFAAWRRIAGDALAEQTAASKFEDGKLVIAVKSEIWKRNLKEMGPDMAFRINSVLGGSIVRSIEFIVDEKQIADVIGPDSRTTEQDSDAQFLITPELRRSAETISDMEMRLKFLLAAGSCLKRKETLTKDIFE
ncbi:MAG: DUF721 domain-containing protein [Pyrinomonadaceae bacterium]